MKLKDLFIGKLVKGIKGKVPLVYQQDNSTEPFGYIKGFSYIKGEIHPLIHWIGQDSEYDRSVDPANLTEVEE